MERRRLKPELIQYLAPRQEVALSSITASELLVGVHRADSQARRGARESFVERVLTIIPVVQFDLAIARVHARLSSDLLSRGRAVGQHDLIIGATALATGFDVLTDNGRDFIKLDQLTVLLPTWDNVP